MARPAEEFTKAITAAAPAAEACMISGGYPALGERRGEFARHLAGRLEFSFYEMAAGPDLDADRKSAHLEHPMNPENPFDRAPMVFVHVMDLYGYAIRDDYSEFKAEFTRALEGWYEPEAGPAAPSLR